MMTNHDMEQLLEVCVALTSEQDNEKFLTLVLDAAMSVARCDGGTLYLLEDGSLKFSRMMTKSLGIRQGGHDDPISLPPVPLEPQYVCAWAAIRQRIVNIPDVRNSRTYDFSGTLRYDRMTGYCTRSMLVIPMIGKNGNIIGVMQLINAMDQGKVVPFSGDMEQLVSALVSQAAACIVNMRYACQVNDLLDSLVDALTTAIDDRTPYNAKHTRNMTGCAERFLAWAKEHDPEWEWTADHVRAFLLSVKLHDVGKLITPRSVMNKETRLGDKMARIEERFRRFALLDRIALLEGRITEECCRERTKSREDILSGIRRMNVAPVLTEEDIQWAADLAAQFVRNEDGAGEPVLTQEEAECLRIRRGTLTDSERHVMETHVTGTAHILEHVRFPAEYGAAAFWAANHHEYLDGSGYPHHLTADEIPIEVRLMTVLDIFDSLVAADRPYKKAVTPEKAFEILKDMGEQGKLDNGLISMFGQSEAWKGVYT